MPGQAVAIATLSLLVSLLIAPPTYWHFRNRNLGAAVLVVWIIYLNFQTFLNAIIWGSEDASRWFDGRVVCDAEVKLQLASSIAIPAALVCVLRALAEVMDTRRATMSRTQAQRRRGHALDLALCFVPPMLHMIAQYLVQPYRYYIFGISGCVPAVNVSWLSILLVFSPPLVVMGLGGYYAVLIIVRLYRYRVSFTTILANSNTTKSRFLRLYILCLVFLAGVIPTQLYVFGQQIGSFDYTYDWATVHEGIDQIIIVSSGGLIRYDRYIWLVMGMAVFVFFGLGKEAVAMYRAGLLAMRFDAVFPVLQPAYVRHEDARKRWSFSDGISSITSKAALLVGRGGKANHSSLGTATTSSTMTECDFEMPSFKGDVRAAPREARSDWSCPEPRDSSKTAVPLSARITGMFVVRDRHVPAESRSESYTCSHLNGGQAMIESRIRGGDCHETTIAANEVLIRREVRQGSESEPVLPSTVYRGVI